MNPDQKRCLYFYLGIKDIHENRLRYIRELVYSYYSQRVSYEQGVEIFQVKCELCGNSSENNIIYKDTEGMRICNGYDNKGCGNVLNENELIPPPIMISEQPISRFSQSYYFKSSLNTDGPMSRCNKKVERNLSKYMSSNLTTSDHYKNKQRKRIYILMDQLKESRFFEGCVIDKVKECFHQYRKAMTRIHNLKCVLFVLFELVIDNRL